jgi:hypothetical protein
MVRAIRKSALFLPVAFIRGVASLAAQRTGAG